MAVNQSYNARSIALSCCGFITAVLCISLGASESNELETLYLNSFDTDSPDLGWYVQNDNVMGGKSEGGFNISSGQLIFSGNTNTDGGGFSSIRSKPLNLDLSAYDGIRVKVEADGRRYTWGMQTNALWRGRRVGYWADFDTTAGETEVIDIPFADFFPQYRGFKLDGPELNIRQISEFALYQYDKTDGPFELRLISVQAYVDSKEL